MIALDCSFGLGLETVMKTDAQAAGSYGFTCAYCEVDLDTPFSDHVNAATFAQENGWRVTFGSSRRWGEGANNTCPDCVPINPTPGSIHPISV